MLVLGRGAVIYSLSMRILINASTSIGDSLYFTFLLEYLGCRYPDATLQVLCWHPMVSWYEAYPFIQQVIAYDQVAKDDAFAFFLLTPRIDLYVDLQHTLESADIAALANAPERIGINPLPETFDKYTYVIHPEPGEQLQECFVRGARAYWQDTTIAGSSPLRIPSCAHTAADSFLAEQGIASYQRYAVIHPGAKGREKLWDNEKWMEVVRFFHSRRMPVLLIGSHLRAWGGADICDAENCAIIHNETPDMSINCAGKIPDCTVLAAIIQRCYYYCGLDTGPTHLAALLGVPVLDLYKYSDESTYALWRPAGKHVTVIPKRNMRDISSHEVILAIEKQVSMNEPLATEDNRE